MHFLHFNIMVLLYILLYHYHHFYAKVLYKKQLCSSYYETISSLLY
jgi:hypothetical protein